MKKLISVISLVVFVLGTAVGQGIPNKTNPPRLVNDFSEILTHNEANNLEKVLVDFANRTSTQILIVTVKSLEGYDIGDFAVRVGEKWGVGQKEHDNGVVIILKPKTLSERGEVYVATGYGVEHLIPDAIANRDIVEKEMIPNFKRNDYYGGLVSGVKVIMDLVEGEYTATAYHQKAAKRDEGGSPFFFLFILLFFILIPILRGRRRRFYSAGHSLPFWLAMGMMGSNRSSHSGSFSNFSSGSGSFGGFGGFGGGSFGGGGAGGSW